MTHKFTHEFIANELANDSRYIRFTKVTNNEERLMFCTRNIEVARILLGEKWKPVYANEFTKSMTTDAIRVFDLDIRDWRTIRIDTIYHCGSQP